MNFEPEIWGPHYWFFLHTVAESYQLTPNDITKRKYYDLIQNMPMFIPNDDISSKFSSLINNYPVTPYLDSRESFVRWVHFIHNKINYRLGKKELSLPYALEKYREQYKPRPIIFTERVNLRKHYIHAALILVFLFLIYLYW